MEYIDKMVGCIYWHPFKYVAFNTMSIEKRVTTVIVKKLSVFVSPAQIVSYQ